MTTPAHEVIERRAHVSGEICRRAIAAFDQLAELHVAHEPDTGHRVLQFGALGVAGSRMNEFGHLVPDQSPAQALKSWLNSLRAGVPAQFGFGMLYPELTLVCRAPEGSEMPSHRDYPWRCKSAILYLNDDFEGGETCFADGKKIRPETGKIVIFDGSNVDHEVAPVRGGSRYNVSLWWTRDPLRLEA